jgi:hypothetical protein
MAPVFILKSRCSISNFFLILFLFVPAITICSLDVEHFLSGGYKPESFFGRNIHFLNSNNDHDQIWYIRHILDLNLDILFGKQQFGHDVAEFMFTLRNKAIWGNKESIAQTTVAESKVLDAVGRPHKHFVPRHFLWMREAWLRLNINEVFPLSFTNRHTFTIGYFPFQVGRGISLGAAFAVGPEILGFYSDSSIDQFAPGFKLGGNMIDQVVSYDLYWEVVRNKSTTISETEAKILGQEFGRRSSPQRGFGKINQIYSGRLIWYPLYNGSDHTIVVEPYFVFNNDPEQNIEFEGDASSKLGTIGVACDYASKTVDFGFEYALNLGCQRVKGWDRNTIVHQNRNGDMVFVNSHVILGVNPRTTTITNLDPYKVPHAPVVVDSTGQLSSVGRQAQDLINETYQDETQNGLSIGVVNGLSTDLSAIVPCLNGIGLACDTLYNAVNRFRNPYCNRYKGWMFVADIAWWLLDRDLKCALAIGVSSGDNNPNFETKDGDFAGFIPLQSIYSGKQVRSAFLLGGAGKIQRPLSEPTTEQAPNKFSQTVSGFTNLVLSGIGFKWMPCSLDKRLSFHPNILAYWQEHRSQAFNLITKMDDPNRCARQFLGVEANFFLNYNMYQELNFYIITSIFIPGGHFKDIKGKPLNSDQFKRLDILNRTGVTTDQLPNIGDSVSYTYNCGLEFKF